MTSISFHPGCPKEHPLGCWACRRTHPLGSRQPQSPGLPTKPHERAQHVRAEVAVQGRARLVQSMCVLAPACTYTCMCTCRHHLFTCILSHLPHMHPSGLDHLALRLLASPCRILCELHLQSYDTERRSDAQPTAFAVSQLACCASSQLMLRAHLLEHSSQLWVQRIPLCTWLPGAVSV